jgi:hypothetical protein
MTTADILSRVIDAAKHAEGSTLVALEILQEDLTEQIYKEMAKKQGRGNAAATIRRMLKSCENSRKILSYAYLDDQGRQCTLDGYRAYRLNKPLPLPEMPDDLLDKKIDVAKIFDPVVNTDRLPLPMPTVQELKAHIAIERAKTRKDAKGRKPDPMWSFGPSLPTVNAVYLLDLLTVMPDAKLTTQATSDAAKRLTSPLHATSEAGDALLLPIRDMDKVDLYAKANNAGMQLISQLYPEKTVEDNTCNLDTLARVLASSAA